jgi:O-acetyl-ADP-ribose deacetylase (regulator of RNase III)
MSQASAREVPRRSADRPGRRNHGWAPQGTLGDPHGRADVREVPRQVAAACRLLPQLARRRRRTRGRDCRLPAISTGVYRWPIEDAARIALETVRASDTRLAEVRFVLFDQRAYEAFTAQAAGEG